MREIKFRAWDGRDMRYWGFVNKPNSFKSPPTTSEMNMFEMSQMQYTGLLDCHGKEIYEGDILKWSNPSFKELKQEYKILTIHDIRSTLNLESEAYDGYLEVIGNIWENPELLTRHT